VPNRAVWIDLTRDENSASRSPARLDALSARGLQIPPRHLQIVMGLRIHPELRAIAKVQAERDE